MNNFSTEEILAFIKYQEDRNRTSNISDDFKPSQFEKDFEEISRALIPSHNKNRNFNMYQVSFNLTPIFREKNFIIGPLFRMAKIIGIENLRFIFSMGRENSFSRYRLCLSERKPLRGTRTYKQEKTIAENFINEQFVYCVLALEKEGYNRESAMRQAASSMKLSAQEIRSLERRFKSFRDRAESLGFVPSSMAGITMQPRYPIKNLRAAVGPKKKSTTKWKS